MLLVELRVALGPFGDPVCMDWQVAGIVEAQRPLPRRDAAGRHSEIGGEGRLARLPDRLDGCAGYRDCVVFHAQNVGGDA